MPRFIHRRSAGLALLVELIHLIESTPSPGPAVIRLVDKTFGAAAASETAPAVGAEDNDSITLKATAKVTSTMILQYSEP